MDGLLDALAAFGALLLQFATVLAGAAWWAITTYPDLRNALIIGITGFGIVWFLHGLIRQWKPCPKGGRNTSKHLFKGTWSDRDCCSSPGSGRHLRVPARIVNRLRHR